MNTANLKISVQHLRVFSREEMEAELPVKFTNLRTLIRTRMLKSQLDHHLSEIHIKEDSAGWHRGRFGLKVQ